MKKAICLILSLIILLACAPAALAETSGAEPENGAVLYENDFSDGLPADFRFPKGHEGKVYVQDGFLYLDAINREFTRVFLPGSLDVYGDYEITIHATILQPADSARWGSIVYRAQNVDYPYYQMCFRYDSNAANGVEFALRNENNAWDVKTKGPSTGHVFSADVLDEIKVTVSGDRAVHSINGDPAVDCNDADTYAKGGIGLQANKSILKVDDIKVTYIKAKKTASPAFTEIAQDDLGVIGGYTLSEYYGVRPAEKLTSEAIPANVIMRINGSLDVLDENGKKICTADEALASLSGRIMPTFRVEDGTACTALCGYLSDNGITDVFVMSGNGDIVRQARTAYKMCRGVLDLTEELKGKTELSDKELLDVRRRTNASLASIAVIPDTLATTENVKYLYDRLIAVWVGATSHVGTKAQAFSIAAAGGHGAVTDNTALMYDVIENLMSGNKLFRVPLNIGHRGIPTQAPENTVEGSLLACEQGADCIENDIYLTADGELMVMHDATTTRTAGGSFTMEKATSEQLRSLTVNKQYPNKKDYADCKIPYLYEYFEALKGKDTQIFVEIKSTSKELVDKLYALITEYGVEDQVSVITFHESQIMNLKEVFPEMSAGFLCNPLASGATGAAQSKSVLSRIQRLSSTYNPSYSGHDAEFAKNANMRGITTWPWTIDDKGVYTDFFMSGFNGLTTNNCRIPAKWIKTLRSGADSYELMPGETLDVSASAVTYKRETQDVSDTVRVIPLTDGMTVGDGNVISFDRSGTHSFALELTYKINPSNSYTLYTQPVTVTVSAPAVTDTETETDVQSAKITTDMPDQGGKNTFPVIPVVIGAAVAVAAVVAVIIIIIKKKKS